MCKYLLLGLPLAFACAVQPGPFQAFVISQTLSRGWRRSFPAAFAPLLSDIPVIILVLLILRHMPNWLIHAFQCAGGALLMYLAVSAWNTLRAQPGSESAQAQPGERTFFKAVLVNLLNPGPYLGWSLVMGPLFITGWRSHPINGVALLISFYLTMVISLLGIIAIVAVVGRIGAHVTRILMVVSAIALACFGAYNVWLAGYYFLWA